MRTHSQPKKKKNLGLRYRWTIDHNRPWNDLIDISLKLYNYASHIKPSINFSTSLPSLILWPYINLNHKKCKLKNYPCLQKRWTSTCSNSFQHNYCSKNVCRAPSPSIWTEVQLLGDQQYSWTSYNTRRKNVQTNTGSTMYLNCFIYAWLKQPCCEHLKKSQQKHIRRNHMYLLCQRRSIPQMSCIFDITAHPHSHPSIPLE